MQLGGIDLHVQTGTEHGSTGGQRPHTGIAHAGGVAFLGHGAADDEGLRGHLHRAQRHFGGMQRGTLYGFLAGGFLGVGLLRHTEGGHDAVEGLGVFVDELQQKVYHVLSHRCPVGELLPAVVPSGFVGREVGHHRAQRSAEGSHIGGHGAAAGGRTLARGLIGKVFRRQVYEFVGSRVVAVL